jgi:hypothetical protein
VDSAQLVKLVVLLTGRCDAPARYDSHTWVASLKKRAELAAVAVAGSDAGQPGRFH